MQDDELQRLRRQLEAAVSGFPPPAEAIPMLTEIVEPVGNREPTGERETAANLESVGDRESAATRERPDGSQPPAVIDADDARDTGMRRDHGIDAMTQAAEATVERLLDDPALLDAAVREAVEAATARFAESLETALKAALRERLESKVASLPGPARAADRDAPGQPSIISGSTKDSPP